ncbi:PEP/pyruvate-binding domain-containing protein [Microbaculum sp. A6E488]|uniref:Phosphoenolpyruvate synthase n=1 Tax=Microbaculum marinisediminis TaxID=2931392 RepID=A0AAW5R556_9HYPH|nr:PEP/pyruvate-binding domain-containing protein [Microbaculum sp. A6E488]
MVVSKIPGVMAACLVATIGLAAPEGPAAGFEAQKLAPDVTERLDQAWSISRQKIKGPFGPNTCVCNDGRSAPLLTQSGEIRNICGDETLFCAAFKADWGRDLETDGVYVANIFSRDLYEWDRIADHFDLVRGYILERYVIDTSPENKLSQMRQYGGLSGAEYEIVAKRDFYERFLAAEDYNDFRHFLLAYELQKRHFSRGGFGKMQEVRNMASRIQGIDGGFKPLRDAVHNQVSASLIPILEDYRDNRANARTQALTDELIAEIRTLTSLDVAALDNDIGAIENQRIMQLLTNLSVRAAASDGVETMAALGEMMRVTREAVADGTLSPGDRRRAIDLNIVASAVMQSEGSRLRDDGKMSIGQTIAMMRALVDGAYGVGLLSSRERASASNNLQILLLEGGLEGGTVPRAELKHRMALAARVVEWAQNSAVLAFAEVWSQWLHLMPEVGRLPDDIVRGSPLLLYADAHQDVSDFAVGLGAVRHELAGTEVTGGVRALNPGLAVGPLLLNPESGSYSRSELVALAATPEDLQPTAGILTQGEGNVVSHVQLLARALGIPNAVAAKQPFDTVAALAQQDVFYAVTPNGRVILKNSADMTDLEKDVLAEYTANVSRDDDGELADAGGTGKLHIDKDRLDLSVTAPVPLTSLRRKDSGILSGPKAAFLGELKHLFPDNVARGVVLPFGVYYEHYRRARVSVPENLAGKDIAEPGQPLPDFVRATYAQFFGEMIPSGLGEKDLSDWIKPRLDVIVASIIDTPLDEGLKAAIATELDKQGLLDPNDPSMTVGCFVRSDTNVEDMENFNGAGLNLTIFNLVSLDDIYAGVKEVWASPFRYRSFSWRQTLIDDPEWVLPSVIILESVPSEKSGVAITADINSGDPDAILMATSEGVGGAVDGTPAETLLWSAYGIELVTMFKSPTRRMLKPEGGVDVIASTGREHVLSDEEVAALSDAARKIEASLEPTLNAAGTPRPWDIEYGFADGKLWLFQTRPFIGSDEVANLPALSRLDDTPPSVSETVAFDEVPQ